MGTWTRALCILFLLAAKLAWALPETVIVSDIDDTIRKTQVQARGALIGHLANLMTHRSFAGMPALYSILAGNGVRFQYVSAAPQLIGWFPEKFLLGTAFPPGPLRLRPSLYDAKVEFKVGAIETAMRENPSAQFILIGDNGEYDPEVYERLRANPEFQDRVKQIFIHKLYAPGRGMDLLPGQRAYITAAELALDFMQAGYLSETQTEVVLRQVEASLKSASASIRARVIPEFAHFTSADVIAFHERRHAQSSSGLRDLIVSIAKLQAGFLQPGDGLRDVYFNERVRACRRVFQ